MPVCRGFDGASGKPRFKKMAFSGAVKKGILKKMAFRGGCKKVLGRRGSGIGISQWPSLLRRLFWNREEPRDAVVERD